MKLSPIKYSNTLPILVGTDKRKNKTLQVNKKTDNFPSFYGQTNVAFCARKKKSALKNSHDVGLNEFIEHYEKGIAKPKPLLYDLPLLPAYKNSVFEAVKYLSSMGSCIIISQKDIDSKEIFESNLRSFIDTDKLKKIGFDRGKPFIHLDLSDYIERVENAFVDMQKDLNRRLNKGSQTPILMVDGLRAFFDMAERPYDFANNSIFKKYPTIFYLDEGANYINLDDTKNLQLGFMTQEDREKQGNSIIYNEYAFKRTLSKIAFLNGQTQIKLPSVDFETAIQFFKNPWVQKHLITRGNDIHIENQALEYTILLGRALSYFEDDYYNTQKHSRLLYQDTVPINRVIEILRCALNQKLMRYPDSKILKVQDITNSFPNISNCLAALMKFSELKNLVDKNAEDNANKLKAKKAEAADKKEETAKEEEPKAEKEEADADKEDTKTYGFNVVLNPKTRFSDVGGMYHIKNQLRDEFIDILRNPRVKNHQKPSGILLSGPPGCGKTLLARAIAGEAEVPFISTSGSDFIEKYVGVGPKRVRELYAAAREAAKNHPSKTAIVFIDEVDAVASSREHNGGSEDIRTINALLHEMDGSNNKDENDIKIITIAATNYEEKLDKAFLRNGRIDLKYKIDDPRYSTKAREEILKIHAKDLVFSSNEEKEQIIKALAQTTSGLSGADLAELLKKANRMSLNVKRQNNYITTEDIKEAQMQVIAGIKTDIEHTSFELKQTVAHEAGHAVNSMVMEKIFENEQNRHKMPKKILDFITNSARGSALGTTYFKPSNENRMDSKESCLADLITIYGGYATESEMFDTHSAGIGSDLKYATKIIENAVSNYDFGKEKHYLALSSPYMQSLFNEEIKNDILSFANKGMQIAKEIISFTRPFIEYYVNDILSNESNIEKIVTSEEFKSKFADWLNSSGKIEEYETLCNSIKSEISEFCDEKGKKARKLGF